MTDRELLELAAKAAGISGSQCEWKTALRVVHERGVAPVLWNPLTNDGDALRLAVRVGIELGFGSDFVNAGCSKKYGEWHLVEEQFNDDPEYATRRAITRAAADIGGMMK
jgi:hypothetical protein